jgi:hypothetical protein
VEAWRRCTAHARGLGCVLSPLPPPPSTHPQQPSRAPPCYARGAPEHAHPIDIETRGRRRSADGNSRARSEKADPPLTVRAHSTHAPTGSRYRATHTKLHHHPRLPLPSVATDDGGLRETASGERPHPGNETGSILFLHRDTATPIAHERNPHPTQLRAADLPRVRPSLRPTGARLRSYAPPVVTANVGAGMTRGVKCRARDTRGRSTESPPLCAHNERPDTALSVPLQQLQTRTRNLRKRARSGAAC